MGLWDLVQDGKELRREIYPPMLDALRAAQRLERKFDEFRGVADDGLNIGDRAEPTGERVRFGPVRRRPGQ